MKKAVTFVVTTTLKKFVFTDDINKSGYSASNAAGPLVWICSKKSPNDSVVSSTWFDAYCTGVHAVNGTPARFV